MNGKRSKLSKRILAFITAFFIIFNSGFNVLVVEAGQREDIVNVALGEVGVSGVPNKYTYNLGKIAGTYNYAWCCAFVVWCADQVGAGHLIPRTASVRTMEETFKSWGQWQSRDSGYSPQPGDVIFIENGDGDVYADHVGIVNYASNGRVYTIEGNARNVVKLNGGYTDGYALTDSKIAGYGMPAYSGNKPEPDPIPGVNPEGMLDVSSGGINSVYVKGWAFDADDVNAAVEMHVYVDGVHKHTTFANQYYPNLNANKGCGDNHGFETTFRLDNTYEGEHTVEVFALDLGRAGGQNVSVGQGKVTITKDNTPPVIKDAQVCDLSPEGYTVTCKVTDNDMIDWVTFPTWTANEDQDDIIWGEGVINGDTYTYRVNVSEHNNESGVYGTHIYAYDYSGNSTVEYLTVIVPEEDKEAPVISDIKIKNQGPTGYTVECKVKDNVEVDRVLFPTWTLKDGQDDIVWEEGTKNGDIYTYRVDIKDHNNELGEYTTHIHAYDTSENLSMDNTSINMSAVDEEAPIITDVVISDLSPKGYTVTCKVTDNLEVDRVQLAVWSQQDGQDDLFEGWATNTKCSATKNGDIYTYRVNVSDHSGVTGNYHTHIYAYDTYGNSSMEPKFFAVPASDETSPVISDVEVTDLTSEGYWITCKVTDDVEVKTVKFPTWTVDAGQDDMNGWGIGTKDGDYYRYYVDIKEHNNERGMYVTNIYAYDTSDNVSRYRNANDSLNVTVIVPEPEEEEKPLVNPFVDINESNYYYDAVLWAVDKGITTGKDATHFQPTAECTRAQVVTFLWRSQGCPKPQTTVNPFVDVPNDKYYTDAVLWAYENNITSGKDATHFQPDVTVTRNQFVTFLWRLEGKPSPTINNPFDDVPNGTYYTDAVLWAFEKGITTGKDATHFQPLVNCQRCQVVTFLYRAYK